MEKYRVEIKRSAFKEIKNLPPKDIKRVLSLIEKLVDDPRPPGCKKLSDQEKYRIRIGQCRILYTIEDDVLYVYIIKVGHRRDVYK